MELTFSGEMWFWRGPSPFHFITVPAQECAELEAASKFVSYGWGMIPVTARIGQTVWQTSLYPQDGRYIVPVRTQVRKAEGLDLGDTVTVRLAIGARLADAYEDAFGSWTAEREAEAWETAAADGLGRIDSP